MQFSQEDADLRLLRTPFSICWSSLTEIALSCEHRHGHHKIIKPLLSASLTTNVAQVKKWFKLIKKTFWMQLLLGLTSPASWSNSLLRPFSSSVSSAGRLGGGGWEQTHSVSTSRAEGFSDPGWTTYLREVRVHGAAHLSVGENLTWVKKIPRCCSGAGNLTLTQLQPSSRRTSWPGSLPRGGAGRWWAPAGILQEAAWIALTPPVCWCTSCCGPSTHGSGRSLSMLVPHSPEPPKAITGTFIVLKIIRREEERRWHEALLSVRVLGSSLTSYTAKPMVSMSRPSFLSFRLFFCIRAITTLHTSSSSSVSSSFSLNCGLLQNVSADWRFRGIKGHFGT